MLHKSRGIVIHALKYSETSLVVKIYTEAFGLQSYLVKGARSRKASVSHNLFQPMTLLDLVVSHKEGGGLQHIREAGMAEPFHSLSSELRKRTIVLFLSEVLIKSLREDETNAGLFDFLVSSLRFFELQEDGVEFFHLYFLLHLSRYLGFFPQGETENIDSFFDLREGKFSILKPAHPDFLDNRTSRLFARLITSRAVDLPGLAFSNTDRKELLDALLLYYLIHQSGMGSIRSAEVLREVFR
jgi:DNA repair protein RecO (recombination protein O)